MKNYTTHIKQIRLGKMMLEIELAWWAWGIGACFDYYGDKEWSYSTWLGPIYIVLWSNWED